MSDVNKCILPTMSGSLHPVSAYNACNRVINENTRTGYWFISLLIAVDEVHMMTCCFHMTPLGNAQLLHRRQFTS